MGRARSTNGGEDERVWVVGLTPKRRLHFDLTNTNGPFQGPVISDRPVQATSNRLEYNSQSAQGTCDIPMAGRVFSSNPTKPHLSSRRRSVVRAKANRWTRYQRRRTPSQQLRNLTFRKQVSQFRLLM
jgi:hypothetical protein